MTLLACVPPATSAFMQAPRTHAQYTLEYTMTPPNKLTWFAVAGRAKEIDGKYELTDVRGRRYRWRRCCR